MTTPGITIGATETEQITIHCERGEDVVAFLATPAQARRVAAELQRYADRVENNTVEQVEQ